MNIIENGESLKIYERRNPDKRELGFRSLLNHRRLQIQPICRHSHPLSVRQMPESEVWCVIILYRTLVGGYHKPRKGDNQGCGKDSLPVSEHTRASHCHRTLNEQASSNPVGCSPVYECSATKVWDVLASSRKHRIMVQLQTHFWSLLIGMTAQANPLDSA